jgi:hypothetical protein
MTTGTANRFVTVNMRDVTLRAACNKIFNESTGRYGTVGTGTGIDDKSNSLFSTGRTKVVTMPEIYSTGTGTV